MHQRLSDGLPAIASIGGTLTVLALVLAGHRLGALSSHMAAHIALMNVVAPIVAIAVVGRVAPFSSTVFWSIAIAQVGVLWFWHLPAVAAAATSHASGTLLMHGSLLAIASLFWIGVLQMRGGRRWQTILGLIITGKLSCLLAALLIFSPRFLYTTHNHSTTMDDQQLAGLLMITACPVSYVLAGIMIAASMAGVLPASKHRPKHARAA